MGSDNADKGAVQTFCTGTPEKKEMVRATVPEIW